MAKINTSAIEGYADMSAEEKLAALEAMDLPDVDKIKSALDKATSEAAGYKKQLRERMTEDEARAAMQRIRLRLWPNWNSFELRR